MKERAACYGCVRVFSVLFSQNQEIGLRLCARVEELERLYKRKAAQFDDLWRRLSTASTSPSGDGAAASAGLAELQRVFDLGVLHFCFR